MCNDQYIVCPVCLDLAFPIAYQCKNGHLICHICYNNPLFVVKHCPVCQECIKCPTRNRIAEKVISQIPVKCGAIGCNVATHYDKMRAHVTQLCQYTKVDCEYKELGCSWNGIRKDLKNHTHVDINYDVLKTRIMGINKLKQQIQSLTNKCNLKTEIADINLSLAYAILHETVIFEQWNFTLNKQIASMDGIVKEFIPNNSKYDSAKCAVFLDFLNNEQVDGIDVMYKLIVQLPISSDRVYRNVKILIVFGDCFHGKMYKVISKEISGMKTIKTEWATLHALDYIDGYHLDKALEEGREYCVQIIMNIK